MIPLSITTDIEKFPWGDQRESLHTHGLGKIIRVGRLPKGTTRGLSSVSIVIEMPDGRQFVAETSMDLFLNAARAFKAVEDEMSGANAKN